MEASGGPASLLTRLQQRRPEVEQAILARVEAVADPGEVEDPKYVAGLREAVSAGVLHGLAVINSPDEELLPVPEALLAQARYASRSGVKLDTVLRRYFAAYTSLGDFLMRDLESGDDLSAEELKRLSRTLATAFDRIVAAISAEYTNAENGRVRSLDAARCERVRRLLAGEPVSLDGLGYEFDARWHLGAIAFGPGARVALRRLGANRDLLLVDDGGGAVWAWFGGEQPLAVADVLGRSSAGWPTEVALAVGEPGEGMVGWRLTHRQAKAALPVALRAERKRVGYRDCALLAAAIADEVLAWSLREAYIDPLARQPDGGTSLRRTLSAYFAAERNVSSAAAALGASRQTVNKRLALSEKLIGRSLGSCAAELETALSLAKLEAGGRSM